LLFLHADTRLAPGWAAAAAAFMAEPANAARAAAFRFALDDEAPAARRLERLVAWRCRVLGLPYGDQGLLLSRAFQDELGGFRPLPLMEDVDMVRRIGRRRLVMLEPAAVTSAVRYRRDGYLVRPLRNALCLGLYLAGVPTPVIARLYG
ncbi:MAG: glycosyl transferase family 2, partial [Alphaproteobacteria bacterium]